MKKVIFIITSPHWGGAQRYIFDLSTSLKEEFDILVCSGNESGILLDKLSKIDIKTHIFKHLKRAVLPIKDILAIFEIATFYNKEKPDVVHLNSSKAGIIGSLAKSISIHKPKIIYTVHGWVFNEPMSKIKKNIYIFLEKLASKFRNKIIVLGKKEKDVAIEYKICKEDKLEVIYNAILGLTVKSKTLARKELDLPQEKIIIGTIAGFYKTKGLEYLIDAGIKLPDFNFVIIGDGPELENYKLLITNYKLKNFKLLGYKENASQYLNAFDVFVLPSLKEGCPYVLLEAMYAGLPIIATRVGTVEEMMNNYKNKILINPKNIKELKDAIINIKKEIVSPTPQNNYQSFIEKIKQLYK